MISTVLKGDCRCEKDELILAMYEKVESNLKSIIDVLKKLKLDSKINEDLFIKLKNAKIDLDSVSKELDIFLKGIKLHLLILKGSKDSKEI